MGRNINDRGMATVELALISLVAAAGLGLCIWLLGAMMLLNHCQVTANEVARQQARGDAAAVARAVAGGPAGARVSRSSAAGATVVTVRADAGFGTWFSVPVEARASVLDEVGR